jgi:hypothetical protein
MLLALDGVCPGSTDGVYIYLYDQCIVDNAPADWPGCVVGIGRVPLSTNFDAALMTGVEAAAGRAPAGWVVARAGGGRGRAGGPPGHQQSHLARTVNDCVTD